MGALPSLEKAHREKADSFLFREKESAFSLIEEKGAKPGKAMTGPRPGQMAKAGPAMPNLACPAPAKPGQED